MKINKEIKNLIEENALSFCTVNEDNSPHCIAVAFCKVIDEDKILITDNYMNHTPNNLKRNNKVSCVVWNKEWQENCCGYQLNGEADYYNDGEWCDTVKNMPENKDEPCKGAVLIKITQIKQLA